MEKQMYHHSSEEKIFTPQKLLRDLETARLFPMWFPSLVLVIILSYTYRIQEKLEHAFAAYCSNDVSESESKCQRVLESLHTPIQQAIKSGQYRSAGGYEDYSKAMDNLETEYRNTKGKGCQVTYNAVSWNIGLNI